MSNRDELEERLARLREATRALTPPDALVARVERLVIERRRRSATGGFIARRARPLLLACAGVAAAALLAAWHTEAEYDAAVAAATLIAEASR